MTAKFLSVLLPCDVGRAEGFVFGQAPSVGEIPVRLFHHSALNDLLRRYGQFQRKYAEISPDQQKKIKGLLMLSEAARAETPRVVSDLAHSLAGLLLHTIEQQAELWEGNKDRPLKFLETHIDAKVSRAKLVLWRPKSGGSLSAGILCEDVLQALYVLLVFRIGVGLASGTGWCVICGHAFVRERGARRNTCSSKCRKQKSRLNTEGKGRREK